MTIAITGVTGNIGSRVAELISQKGLSARHLARSPEKAKKYAKAELFKASFDYSSQTIAALKGVDTLFMVSAAEHPKRLQQHFAFIDAAKEAGVKHIIYTSFYNAREQSVFTLARDHAKTENYIKEKGFAYTFLRDNFYLDFFLDLCLENSEIRGPAGDGKVSAVAREDVAEVAAVLLTQPEKWLDRVLNLTGPKELSMSAIAETVSHKTKQVIPYIDETVEEAYASRRAWPAQQWEYDAWVSTYTAIKAGEQAGLTSDIERVLGRPAKSLEELLKDRAPKSFSSDN
ncbi:SDR family oxidoreductase [Streptococcus macacae]|uniref:NmrA family protein n=1 Tax=Streptococcus macacae NCTC 11558 TaxID=764298 RepID=G5JZ52_9STRE|nr:SDR family oxidoreductase [Streptococcus macacae]EHJ52257.1 NmrA family protein [Streptococcus macacae NCTC 11558]SUN78305.1 NmrA-like dehydrogenase/reductase [Streptococcus macacae NCTC 11558]